MRVLFEGKVGVDALITFQWVEVPAGSTEVFMSPAMNTGLDEDA